MESRHSAAARGEVTRRGRAVGRRIERPPAHWSLLFFCMVVVLALLIVHGLSSRTTAASETVHPTHASGLGGQGSLISWSNRRLKRVGKTGDGVVVLTFDDGPDPRWTPQIARVLDDFGVPATFFVTGSRVVRHQAIVHELHRMGFELGNHTFSHARLDGLPGWRRELEISLTESALAGAAGIRPRFFRPPYSGGVESAGAPESLAWVASRGYLIALSDYDSRDWRRPGVGTIVKRATPAGRRGGVILFHDGGGERRQTVAALRILIPRLIDRGFRFATLSEVAGFDDSAPDPPAPAADRLRGDLFIGALTVARWMTALLSALLIAIAVLLVLRAAFLLYFARHHARSWLKRSRTPYLPSVSIVVPAFNEAAVIEQSVRSLEGSDYPGLEVIVVDDGSTDHTTDIVSGLHLDRVRLIRQPNRGKAAALNAGIAVAIHEVIVTVDADTVFESDTLRRLVEPFCDQQVGAVAGNTKVANRRGMLGRWQHIEYVMGFNLDRRLYDVLQCMPTVPGAVGAFRRDALAMVGGFSAATLAEDTDVTIALGRAGWRVVYAEDARAWTEAPGSWSGLWRQRYRWSYGTLQAIWKHRTALWRPGEQRIGRRGIPYLVLFQILLPGLSPLVDAFALYGILFLHPVSILAYWLAFNAILCGLALFAFRLDGESPRALWALPLQQFVYRQLMYLVVVQSILSAVLGLRLRWQHVERSGELEVAAARPAGQ
jgi:cellulose synthase/poly-beta-1,6-N-acetylglucosamine synthase-like glycosyltransferase/peptidoglycan/xylan/chitin deacetylase (PgdA/CDA1 family)